MFWKPKSDIFQHFEALNNVLLEVGEKLIRVPESFPDRIAEIAEDMRKLENKADDITHLIIDEINKTFVTPFDREDLYLLATRIDDVIDHSENAVSNLVIYGIREARPPLAEFCSTVNSAAKEICESVKGLQNLRYSFHVLQHNIEIHTLETKGDELLQGALRELFAKENDIKEIIKWKDIFQSFEKSLDRAEDVANVIEAIILKNA